MQTSLLALITQPVGLTHYLVVSAVLLTCGLVCMIGKRNAVGILMGVELILTAATLNLVAFSNPAFRSDDVRPLGLDGHVFALFVIVLAAGEAAVALAIGLNYYNSHATIDVDRGNELQG